jgi:molybdopterin molybdotransferase
MKVPKAVEGYRTPYSLDGLPQRFAQHASMLPLEDAQSQILSTIKPLPAESLPLSKACGRFLAESIVAPIDLPPFDNSAMDGYAVRATDVASARRETPAILRLIGRIPAGEVFPGTCEPGTCVRLFTGSAMPAGADAVVMQEDTRCDQDKPGHVLFLDGAKPRENVRLRGEDVKRGATVMQGGERLTAGRVGLLAAMGLPMVNARRQPVIGLLATGNELVEPGNPLSSGKIYESNRLSLAALIEQTGAAPKVFPLVADTLDATKDTLARALDECDGVVTSGGVSVGELDFVKRAFQELGGSMEFWKIAVKPGKPFLFGRWREKFLFGLPGNPVSGAVTFLLLVRPALWRWQGASKVDLPAQTCLLAEPLVNRGDRRHFLRVQIDGSGAARSAGAQASHVLSSLALADGLVDVPPHTTLTAGTSVRAILI